MLQINLVCLLFLLLTIKVSGSHNNGDTLSLKSEKKWGVEVSSSAGFLIAHREALMPLQEEHLFSVEGSVFFKTDGTQDWQRSFLLPEWGLHAAWIRTGNAERLGTATALYPYLDFPLSKHPGRKLWFRYGMGLGYVEKIFDPETNFRNVAIGSHMNGVIHFGIRYRAYVSDHSSLDAGLQLTHFSNGSVRMPNLGINLPAISVSYRFGGGRQETPETPTTNRIKRPGYLSLIGAIAWKEVYPSLGPRYNAATLSGTWFFASSKKHVWGIGSDLFYDNSLSVKNGQLYGDYSKAADFRPGIHGAWMLEVNRLGILANIGFYPYTAYKNDGNFYHRIGLRYGFGNLIACLQLKTHYARADFVEWGIGWNFKSKKKP